MPPRDNRFENNGPVGVDDSIDDADDELNAAKIVSDEVKVVDNEGISEVALVGETIESVDDPLAEGIADDEEGIANESKLVGELVIEDAGADSGVGVALDGATSELLE